MHDTRSKRWFGDQFPQLHPKLCQLHSDGGVLTGPVSINTGKGLAGWVGQRLAKKLGIPTNDQAHTLTVSISHHDDGLHWDRCFDGGHMMCSVFMPVGDKQSGYWLEQTGAIALQLTVDIDQGGWYWRVLKTSIKGIPIPQWLFPKTRAYKIIEQDQYRFYVAISLPLLGQCLNYEGLLQLTIDQ